MAKDEKQHSKLLAAVVASDSASASAAHNYVVNVPMLVKMRDEIENAYGGKVTGAELFELFANEVMSGGVIVLTDESTTGQAVSVDFGKKKVSF